MGPETPATAPPASVEAKSQPPNPSKDSKPAAPTEAAAGEKKLSNAELKKKAKEEKAARRAQAKVVQPAPGPSSTGGGPNAATAADGKGGKQKPSQAGGPQQHGKLPVRSSAPAVAAAPKEPKSTIPESVSHLSVARRINMTQADKDVHPAVLVLGQYMSTFAVSDSITRTEATLLAFKKVDEPRNTSPNNRTFSLTRSSPGHRLLLNPPRHHFL